MADGQSPVEKSEGFRRRFQIVNRKSKIVNGFTLVELLVVISIIGLLAAFIFPVASGVKRHQYIQNAQAEMGQLATAIAAYKDAFGYYPPDNPANPMVNQLYYELEGVTNTTPTSSTATYQLLDGSGSSFTGGSGGTLAQAFGPGVGGFVNCNKPGANEESGGGKNFILGLKPNQTTTISPNGIPITAFVTSVGGPDGTYNPLGVRARQASIPGATNRPAR